jgi:hypothetical protein
LFGVVAPASNSYQNLLVEFGLIRLSFLMWSAWAERDWGPFRDMPRSCVLECSYDQASLSYIVLTSSFICLHSTPESMY